MSETTGIAWCDATINFWHGCKKVSEGCKFCYMYRDKDRWNEDGSVVIQAKEIGIKRTLVQLKMQHKERLAAGITAPLKIFTCSWSDFFIDEADSWREQAWQVIREHPQFIWIILTKRIDRVEQCLPPDWGEGWDHVWLCVSAENQERYNERVPVLLLTRAKVRGVSIEPIVGPIDMMPNLTFGHFFAKLDWVIIGGESGNDTGKWLYRKANEEWFHKIVDYCVEQGIPVFMKQLGTWLAKKHRLKDRTGSNLNEYPVALSELRIQQFPNG